MSLLKLVLKIICTIRVPEESIFVYFIYNILYIRFQIKYENMKLLFEYTYKLSHIKDDPTRFKNVFIADRFVNSLTYLNIKQL